MRSLQVSRYLTVHESRSGPYFLFNQAKFRPIRVQGSSEEMQSLLTCLREGNVRQLSRPAVECLCDHHVLVDRGQAEVGPLAVEPSDARRADAGTFTIRIETNIRNRKALQHSLHVVKDHLAQREPHCKRLQVKFIGNSRYRVSLYDFLLPVILDVNKIFGASVDEILFYVDTSLEYVIRTVNRLRLFIVPNVRFNVSLRADIDLEKLAPLDGMVNRYGFLLNFVFLLRADSIERVPLVLDALRSRWKTDFLYSLSIPLREPGDSIPSYLLRLPTPEQMDALLDSTLDDHAPSIAQNTLLNILRKNVETYPNTCACRVKAGNAVYLSGDGDIGTCYRAYTHNRTGVRTPSPDAMTDLLGGLTRGEQVCGTCAECGLRYLCGGECPRLADGVGETECNRRAFALRCQQRTALVERLLFEVTAVEPHMEPNVAALHDFRWLSHSGQLELCTGPQAQLAGKGA